MLMRVTQLVSIDCGKRKRKFNGANLMAEAIFGCSRKCPNENLLS